MATALNSFDRSPLGAFVRSALGARGSAASSVTLRKLGLLYSASPALDGGYDWKNSDDTDARDRRATGAQKNGAAFVHSDIVVYSGEVYVPGVGKYVPTSDNFEAVAGNPGGQVLAVAGGYLFAASHGDSVLHRFDGAAWTNYDLSLAAPFFSSIDALVEHAGLLVVGGAASTVGSAGLATITPATGAIVSTWAPAGTTSVDALCSDGTSIYAAGYS